MANNTEKIFPQSAAGGYIYNITVNVNQAIHNEWLQWMMNIHIPEVLAAGCFKEQRMLRLLDIDETDGPTYAVQYYAESKADYNRYAELYAQKLQQAGTDKWGRQCTSFSTRMQVVH